MISVCIASYNGEKYIKEQLSSILVQLGSHDEIIVSDDGSSDHTLKIIEEFDDQRIKVVLNKLKKGVTHNFENALNHAKGDILFLSDQDDVWLPGKVELSVNELKVYDLVVSNCMVINENKEVIFDSYFKLAKSGKGFLKNFYRSSYLGCCLAFKRDVLNKVLPIPKSLLLFHDWWFGFIAEVCLNVKFIETPCMYYRRHSETTSNTLSKSDLSFYDKIRYRFQLLYLGFIRIIEIKTR
ncbi:glycosyltransferase family 2 protein [Pedobacter sp. FW305-3-2-15-E-R2A2]|uniref:glycosyltransferase family 2 protein n=1 Tax=Pedobacter sp. FW305-3-2-15-E-R2A2 TaxID=3140251 RepID=UPI0031409F67